MDFDLERFIQAQNDSYMRAYQEIRNGKKITHWMWYIFPQLRELAKSDIAYEYGISGLAEARAYLDDPVLGKRLIDISQALLELKNKDAAVIFGWPDLKKLCSCMTLFAEVSADPVFQDVLNLYYSGNKDKRTLHLLQMQPLKYEDLIVSEVVKIQDIMEIADKRKYQYRASHFYLLHPLVQALLGYAYNVNESALKISHEDAAQVFHFWNYKTGTYYYGDPTETQLHLMEIYKDQKEMIWAEYKTAYEKTKIFNQNVQKEKEEAWERYQNHFYSLPNKIQSIVYYESCKMDPSRSTSGFHGFSMNKIAPFSFCGWADYGARFPGVGFRINNDCFNNRDVELYYIDDNMLGDFNGIIDRSDYWKDRVDIINAYSSGLKGCHISIDNEEREFLFRGKSIRPARVPTIRFRLDPSNVKETISFDRGNKIMSSAETGGYVFVLPRSGEFYCELGEIIDGKRVPLHIDDFCMK